MVDCNFKFNKNFTSTNPNRFVQDVIINNKKYIVKKELINGSSEYIFYKNFCKKIINDNFNKTINIPIKILNCSNNIIYLFNYIDYDYVKYKFKNFNNWIDITIQLCLNMYYLNHKLGIFHNDFLNHRNIMIKKNNKPFKLICDPFVYTIKNDYIVIIDYGWQNNIVNFHSMKFYINEYKKIIKNYKFISEVFILFYMSYVKYFNVVDKYYDYYDEIYDSLVNKVNSDKLIDFDKLIIQQLLEIQKYYF